MSVNPGIDWRPSTLLSDRVSGRDRGREIAPAVSAALGRPLR